MGLRQEGKHSEHNVFQDIAMRMPINCKGTRTPHHEDTKSTDIRGQEACPSLHSPPPKLHLWKGFDQRDFEELNLLRSKVIN